GKIDIVSTSGTSSFVSVLRNISTLNVINAGSFAAKVDFAAGANSGSVKVADLDDDGKPDIIVVDSVANVLSMYRNTSAGSISFAAKIDLPTGTKPVSVAVADLDGDGHPDLCYTNKTGNSFSVLHRNSTPAPLSASSFDTPTNFTVATAPGALALGDVDGDGI